MSPHFSWPPEVQKKVDRGVRTTIHSDGWLGEISPHPIRIQILMSLFAMYLVIVRDSVTELSASVPRVLKKVDKVIGGERGRRA